MYVSLIKQKKTYVKLSESVIMTGNMFMEGCQSSAIIPRDRLPAHLHYWQVQSIHIISSIKLFCVLFRGML